MSFCCGRTFWLVSLLKRKVVITMRGKPSNANLQKGKEDIDRFIKGATTEELRARRDWSGVQVELAEYAIRGINDELARRGESDV